MRKVMLATPVAGELPVFYVRNLMQACSARIPNIQWMPIFMMGQGVQIARSECVKHGREAKCDEVIFLDKDLDVNVTQMARMLSHEKEDIVCGMYCKKTTDTHWHAQSYGPDEKEDANGLLRVRQAAIGFSKINMRVFDKIQADNPDRVGVLREKGTGEWQLWDFFPMELMGPNTPLARLNTIKGILDNPALDTAEKLKQIDLASYQQYLEPNYHIGEDYWFCKLARDSGFKIKLDTQLIVQHEAKIRLPIPTAQLIDMLKEDWREDDRKGVIFP